jgi:hypothetical protein
LEPIHETRGSEIGLGLGCDAQSGVSKMTQQKQYIFDLLEITAVLSFAYRKFQLLASALTLSGAKEFNAQGLVNHLQINLVQYEDQPNEKRWSSVLHFKKKNLDTVMIYLTIHLEEKEFFAQATSELEYDEPRNEGFGYFIDESDRMPCSDFKSLVNYSTTISNQVILSRQLIEAITNEKIDFDQVVSRYHDLEARDTYLAFLKTQIEEQLK